MSDRKALAWIFLAAFCVRLIVVLAGIGYDRDLTFWDARDYDRHAVSLLEGRGLTNGVAYASRPPLYPLFLSVLYFVFGHRYPPVRLAQSFLGALSVVLLFLISKRLFPRRVCFLAALFCCLHPILVVYCGNILSETLGVFFLSLVVWALVRLPETKRAWTSSMTGIFYGFLLLTRAALIFLLPFILVWLFQIHAFKWGKGLTKTLVSFGLAVALVLVPWALRNAFVLQAFVPLTTNAGTTLWDANNPRSLSDLSKTGLASDWRMPGNVAVERDGKKVILSELEGDRYLLHKGLDFLKDLFQKNPKTFLLLLFKKFLASWSFHEGQTPLELSLYFLCYAVLGVIGLAFSFSLKPRPYLFYFLILQYQLCSLTFFGRGKYRVVIEPYVMVFAALGCFVCWRLLKGAFSR